MDDTIHMLTTIPIHKIMKVDVIDKEEFDKFKENKTKIFKEIFKNFMEE